MACCFAVVASAATILNTATAAATAAHATTSGINVVIAFLA